LFTTSVLLLLSALINGSTFSAINVSKGLLKDCVSGGFCWLSAFFSIGCSSSLLDSAESDDSDSDSDYDDSDEEEDSEEDEDSEDDSLDLDFSAFFAGFCFA